MLSKFTGVSVHTIKYYEKLGLIFLKQKRTIQLSFLRCKKLYRYL
ncbi:MAG: MerR family transcriptional regulator [Anaerobutyricum soehngenii]